MSQTGAVCRSKNGADVVDAPKVIQQSPNWVCKFVSIRSASRIVAKSLDFDFGGAATSWARVSIRVVFSARKSEPALRQSALQYQIGGIWHSDTAVYELQVRRYEAPFTSTMQPVRASVPSEAKNRTVRATSSGWAARPIGISARI